MTGHPLNRYVKELTHFTTCPIAELHPNNHKTARTAGIITNIRTRQTKRGDRIAIFTLDDGSSQIEVVCFAEVFQKFRALINEDQLIVAEGEVSLDEFNNSIRLMSRDLYTIEEARNRFAKHLQINLQISNKLNAEQLKKLLSNYLGGNCPIVLSLLRDNVRANIKLGKNWLVNPCDDLLTLIEEEMAKVEVVY